MEVVLLHFQADPVTYRELIRKFKRCDVSLTLTHNRYEATSDAYDVDSVPRLLMIDTPGRVRGTYNGHSEAAIPNSGGAADRLLGEVWSPK